MGVIGGSREFVGQGLMEEIYDEEYIGQFSLWRIFCRVFLNIYFFLVLLFSSLYEENAPINWICAL